MLCVLAVRAMLRLSLRVSVWTPKMHAKKKQVNENKMNCPLVLDKFGPRNGDANDLQTSRIKARMRPDRGC